LRLITLRGRYGLRGAESRQALERQAKGETTDPTSQLRRRIHFGFAEKLPS
jgi:hypothetical protein